MLIMRMNIINKLKYSEERKHFARVVRISALIDLCVSVKTVNVLLIFCVVECERREL